MEQVRLKAPEVDVGGKHALSQLDGGFVRRGSEGEIFYYGRPHDSEEIKLFPVYEGGIVRATEGVMLTVEDGKEVVDVIFREELGFSIRHPRWK